MPTAARQFEQAMNKVTYRARRYREAEWPKKVGVATLAWIDGNFRAQGFRDGTLIPWKRTKSGKRVKFGQSSKILIGPQARLMRANKMRTANETATIYNNRPYARVHNEGYTGTQTVKPYTRRRRIYGEIAGVDGKMYAYGARMSLRSHKRIKNAKVTQDVQVKGFTRNMKIPRRQFMPSAQRGSRMLDNELRQMTLNDLQNILKTTVR